MAEHGLPMQYSQVDGHRIAYYRGGSGPPLVLVHGITTYSFIWRNLIADLQNDFEVIAVDLLGCGASDKPTGVDYSIKAQGQIIAALLKTLGIQRAQLNGQEDTI